MYMWEKVDKPHRVEWGDEGFILDLQAKGAYSTRDTCKDPLFSFVNTGHAFWSNRVTTTFIR